MLNRLDIIIKNIIKPAFIKIKDNNSVKIKLSYRIIPSKKLANEAVPTLLAIKVNKLDELNSPV